MNKFDLEKKLKEMNIDERAYCLNGGLPNECYTLDHIGNKWFVYYSERGEMSDKKSFDTEELACQYFLELLSSNF